MPTPTDICNLALRRIGAARISNLQSDQTKEGVVARDIYGESRRWCLNVHNWNFALKRMQLTASATDPVFGWDWTYPLPPDFIRMVSVHPADIDQATVPYRLEFQEGEDRVLVCNANQIWIRYVFDCEDCNLMSATFRDALAFRLARDFAGALSKSAQAADLADKGLTRALQRARSIDGVEDYPEKMAEGSWYRDRFIGEDTTGWADSE